MHLPLVWSLISSPWRGQCLQGGLGHSAPIDFTFRLMMSLRVHVINIKASLQLMGPMLPRVHQPLNEMITTALKLPHCQNQWNGMLTCWINGAWYDGK